MGENRAGKAVLGISLLVWVAYMSWPKATSARGPASIAKQFSASVSGTELTALAAVGLPQARPRAAVFSAAEMGAVIESAPISADQRRSEWKQGTAYLHAGNFAAAGDTFARLSAADRDDISALQGLDAARRRQAEVDTGAGGDAFSYRNSLLNDLSSDVEEAFASGRFDEAVSAGNWFASISVERDSSEAEKVRGIVESAMVQVRAAEAAKRPVGESALTFQLPDSDREPEAE